MASIYIKPSNTSLIALVAITLIVFMLLFKLSDCAPVLSLGPSEENALSPGDFELDEDGDVIMMDSFEPEPSEHNQLIDLND